MAGRYAVPIRFDESFGCLGESVGCIDDSVGRVCVVGSSIFVLIEIESVSDVVPSVVFVPEGVDSKVS